MIIILNINTPLNISTLRSYLQKMSDNNQAPVDSGDNANELTQLVQSMLTQMQNRFQQMSDNIITRIDEMGSRIDDLEKSIGDLVNEAQ